MSSKPPPRPLPEPPGLHTDLAERPEIKALLAELSKGLKPGEDPLFYALPLAPEEPPDPEAKLPDQAQVYVAPAPVVAPVKHKTLDRQRTRWRREARRSRWWWMARRRA